MTDEDDEGLPTELASGKPAKMRPACGRRVGRPILRCMPTDEVFAAIDDGSIDIVLGGCIISPDDHDHRCTNCGTEFDRPLACGVDAATLGHLVDTATGPTRRTGRMMAGSLRSTQRSGPWACERAVTSRSSRQRQRHRPPPVERSQR